MYLGKTSCVDAEPLEQRRQADVGADDEEGPEQDAALLRAREDHRADEEEREGR